MDCRLSIIDLCTIFDGERPGDALHRSTRLAQRAEELGYSRVWYSEHHNMKQIASSSPAVVIAHVAAHTRSIRLGAGGVMLPNHAPYVVAEQFGTLAELHPGRIDLGLGRAPGTDPTTLGRALRRDPSAAHHFPNDVEELQSYLEGKPTIPGVTAVPKAESQVPLFILGSSLFGAHLAAEKGLGFAFASHFAPDLLHEAAQVYKERFQPSTYLSEPYFIAAVNVLSHDTEEGARDELACVKRRRLTAFLSQGSPANSEVNDVVIDSAMNTPLGHRFDSMLRYTALGDQEHVARYLHDFKASTGANELMIALIGKTPETTWASMEAAAAAL